MCERLTLWGLAIVTPVLLRLWGISTLKTQATLILVSHEKKHFHTDNFNKQSKMYWTILKLEIFRHSDKELRKAFEKMMEAVSFKHNLRDIKTWIS